MNSEEQQQIQEEAHYWFCLNDVADYVELLGTNQVIKDVAVLLEQRKELDKRVSDFSQLGDVAFWIAPWLAFHVLSLIILIPNHR